MKTRWPLYVSIALLTLVTVVFVIAFIAESEAIIGQSNVPTLTLSADSYLADVTPLLANGNAERGAALVEQYACVACHRYAGNVKIAPTWVGIAETAATRRPPLTAVAYLYESITNPTAFVVEGFGAAMPQNFAQRLTPQELGDIITYLLSGNAG